MRYTLNKLYGKSKSGKIKEWEIFVEDYGTYAEMVTVHGYIDGKKQTDRVKVTEGKNIGKANETTFVEQAKLNAESKWNSKKDEGYAEKVSDIPEKILPMLAKDYHKCKHKIVFPCYVQPKLDGVRCITKGNGNLKFISRKGKEFETIEHFTDEVKKIIDNIPYDKLDGEIYIHGKTFQEIISAVKNIKNKEKAQLDCNKLQYHIYDIADDSKPFEKRLATLKHLSNFAWNNIVIVKTYLCDDEEDLKRYHDLFVSQGYEGAILRNKLGKYEFDHRSDDLQKYKEFKDEEFEIIDVVCGTGRYANAGTFVCVTSDGKKFNCNPEGTMEIKEEYLCNKQNYIGKLLTVKFQEKSKDGIPRFPVGIGVRDYE